MTLSIILIIYIILGILISTRLFKKFNNKGYNLVYNEPMLKLYKYACETEFKKYTYIIASFLQIINILTLYIFWIILLPIIWYNYYQYISKTPM
jgi:hypothetical protein